MEVGIVENKEVVVGKSLSYNRLSVCALGIAVGVAWALGVLVVGISSLLFGYGVEIVKIFSSMYIGFVATPVGVLIGTLWAFIDGFIGGVIIGFVYNKVLKSHYCKMCRPHQEEK